jgi:transcriptional regulator with XRE-family HTH domain
MVTITESGRIIEAGNENLSLILVLKTAFSTQEVHQMDQKKIGIFIAQRRKELDMTQKELAGKLGITDRAVSKWETGRSLPDLSLLQPLSHVLEIDVNDLLNGAIISEDKYRKKSGENLISLAELNRLKSFRYGYIGFYPLAILLLTYCLIKHIESAGILSLIVVYSTAVYYFRYRTTKDVMSLIIVICGIIGTVGCLMGFVVKTW